MACSAAAECHLQLASTKQHRAELRCCWPHLLLMPPHQQQIRSCPTCLLQRCQTLAQPQTAATECSPQYPRADCCQRASLAAHPCLLPLLLPLPQLLLMPHHRPCREASCQRQWERAQQHCTKGTQGPLLLLHPAESVVRLLQHCKRATPGQLRQQPLRNRLRRRNWCH